MLSDQIVKDVCHGVTTSAPTLAKRMSKILLRRNTKDVSLGTIEDLENAIGLLVVEARDAKKGGKDPKKSEGFRDAVQLV